MPSKLKKSLAKTLKWVQAPMRKKRLKTTLAQRKRTLKEQIRLTRQEHGNMLLEQQHRQSLLRYIRTPAQNEYAQTHAPHENPQLLALERQQQHAAQRLARVEQQQYRLARRYRGKRLPSLSLKRAQKWLLGKKRKNRLEERLTVQIARGLEHQTRAEQQRQTALQARKAILSEHMVSPGGKGKTIADLPDAAQQALRTQGIRQANAAVTSVRFAQAVRHRQKARAKLQKSKSAT